MDYNILPAWPHILVLFAVKYDIAQYICLKCCSAIAWHVRAEQAALRISFRGGSGSCPHPICLPAFSYSLRAKTRLVEDGGGWNRRVIAA